VRHVHSKYSSARRRLRAPKRKTFASIPLHKGERNAKVNRELGAIGDVPWVCNFGTTILKNVFSSDTMPVAVGIVLSVMAFFINNVASEIRSGPAVTYGVEHLQGSQSVVTIQNVSKKTPLKKATFEIGCADITVACLAKFKDTGTFEKIRRQSPVSPTSVETTASNPSIIRLSVTLLPSSQIQVVVNRKAKNPESIMLFFVSEEKNLVPLVVLHRNSIAGLLTRHYLSFMGSVFLLGFAILALYAFMPLIALLRGGANTSTRGEGS
jgi:hypothetical protein